MKTTQGRSPASTTNSSLPLCFQCNRGVFIAYAAWMPVGVWCDGCKGSSTVLITFATWYIALTVVAFFLWLICLFFPSHSDSAFLFNFLKHEFSNEQSVFLPFRRVFSLVVSHFFMLALPQAAFLPYWVNLMLDKREPTGSMLGEGWMRSSVY